MGSKLFKRSHEIKREIHLFGCKVELEIEKGCGIIKMFSCKINVF